MSELTDFETLRDNPSIFVSEILGIDAFDYQAEFMDENADRKTITSGRQVGKSLTCSWYGLHYALTHPMTMTLITAPSLRQSSNLFKTLRSEMSRAGIADDAWGVVRDTQTVIEFDNGSEIHCLPTGRSGNNIRGYSADLIIVDEAAFVEDVIFEDILEPMTFATNGSIVLASTPYGTSGYFYKAHNNPKWFSKRVPSSSNPLISDEQLESFKEGKTRAQIKREVLGEFVKDGSSFFPVDLIRGSLTSPSREADDVYLGADIAAEGSDQTVFAIADGKGNVFEIETHDEMGVLDAADRIEVLDNHYNFKQVAVDRTGLGQGTVEALREKAGLGRRVMDVYLTLQKKQAVYQTFKAQLEEGVVSLPHNDQLRLQMEAMGFKKTKTGNLSIHAKNGFHDDLVDAVAIAVWILPDTAGGGGKRGARGGTGSVTLGDLRESSGRSQRRGRHSGPGRGRSSGTSSSTSASRTSTSINRGRRGRRRR